MLNTIWKLIYGDVSTPARRKAIIIRNKRQHYPGKAHGVKPDARLTIAANLGTIVTDAVNSTKVIKRVRFMFETD